MQIITPSSQLWVSDITAVRNLSPFFKLYSPITQPASPTGHHTLALDPDEPEKVWKAIAYRLLNAGCSVGVSQVGHCTNQPLEWFLSDVASLDNLVPQLMEAEIPWEEWAQREFDEPLTRKPVLELGKLAAQLNDTEHRENELDTLRRRAGVTQWKWDKDYLPLIMPDSSDYRGFSKQHKLPLQVGVEKAREILQADNDELTTNIQLEELRENCGMSGYDWERKIIKPLKKDLEGDRFKCELLGLLQIADPVERIRQQALLAPKYQMSSGLIKEAMAAMKQRTQTPEARLMDLDELFDMQSEGIQWLIPGLLPKGETIILSGVSKAGKTLMAIDAAFAIATGEAQFLGETTQQGKVLFVIVDQSPNSTRMKLLDRGFRRCDKDRVKLLPTWDISQIPALEAHLEDFKPDLVVVDCLRRINKGSEISENSAEFADNIYTLKETLERYGAAGILIHHNNKNNEALGVHKLRGSSAIAGSVWGTWQLEQIPKPDPNNKKRQIIDPRCPKRALSTFTRDTDGQMMHVELDLENFSWKKLGEIGESEEAKEEQASLRCRILNLLAIPSHSQGLRGSQIIELLDGGEANKGSVYNCLNRLVRNKIVTYKNAPNDKRYHIYLLPQESLTEESSFSPPPPSPSPTVVDSDYYAETTTGYSFQDSHHNSHHSLKNSHHYIQKIEAVTIQNVEPISDSEIVTTLTLEEGGGGGKNDQHSAGDNKEGAPIAASSSQVDEQPLRQGELPIYQRSDRGFGTAQPRKVVSRVDNLINPDTPADSASAPQHQLDAIAQTEQTSPIKIGSRVRYTYSGSQRRGMAGTIKKISGSFATVRLDYHQSLTKEQRELESSLKDLELIK